MIPTDFFVLQHQYEPRKPADCQPFGGNRKAKVEFASLTKTKFTWSKKANKVWFSSKNPNLYQKTFFLAAESSLYQY
jgi:hypothetical protein